MGLRFTQATVVGFFLLHAMTSRAATATLTRACDSSVLPGCNALTIAPIDAKGQFGLPPSRDGGSVFNPAAYFSALDSNDSKTKTAASLAIETLRKPVGARIARAKVVADQVRKSAIDFLKLKTPDSAERAGLIARLNSIDIDTETQPDETCGTGTIPGYPNVGFSPTTNTLYLCTTATNASEAILTQALTHEMGHVVSPCMAKSKVYSVDPESLFPAQLSNCSDDFSRFDQEGNRRADVDETAMQLLDFHPKTMIVSSTNASITKLAGCKVLNENPKLNVPSANLFSETKECLTKKFSTSLEDSDAFKSAVVENQMSKSKAHAALHANGSDVCAADFEEAFADRFSASLLAHVSTGWKEADFETATLPLRGLACGTTAGDGLLMSKYEPASVRLTTFLSDPSVGERMKCESPKGAVSCPLKFSSPQSSTPPGKKPVQPPARPARSRK